MWMREIKQELVEGIFSKEKEQEHENQASPKPEQRIKSDRTGDTQEIMQQEQQQQKQIPTHIGTKKWMLQHTMHQIQRKKLRKTQKSRRIIQCWTRQRRQKELE